MIILRDFTYRNGQKLIKIDLKWPKIAKVCRKMSKNGQKWSKNDVFRFSNKFKRKNVAFQKRKHIIDIMCKM
jgi:hypothetical protein